MADAVPALEIARRGTRRPPQWGRALQALRELMEHPEHTHLAYEVFDALDGDVVLSSFLELLSHPEGRRTFRDRSSLLAALDRRELEKLPEESFGRAYLDHIDRHGLDPHKLIELANASERGAETDPNLVWMRERSALAHDLWHVLSGYGADDSGESALLLFSWAQTGSRANALLSLGANWNMLRRHGPGWLRHAWRAWRRGRRAVCLHALPYERLLPLPLEDVRRAAGIDPAPLPA